MRRTGQVIFSVIDYLDEADTDAGSNQQKITQLVLDSEPVAELYVVRAPVDGVVFPALLRFEFQPVMV